MFAAAGQKRQPSTHLQVPSGHFFPGAANVKNKAKSYRGEQGRAFQRAAICRGNSRKLKARYRQSKKAHKEEAA